MTWESYEDGLEDRLRDLHSRVHRGIYRAQASRRIYIPKADGRQRPIGIAALEDKIVQQAGVTVLQEIYETDFRGFSYGFRPGRGAHDALDALSVGIFRKQVNWILDADIRGFFAITQKLDSTHGGRLGAMDLLVWGREIVGMRDQRFAKWKSGAVPGSSIQRASASSSLAAVPNWRSNLRGTEASWAWLLRRTGFFARSRERTPQDSLFCVAVLAPATGQAPRQLGVRGVSAKLIRRLYSLPG